MAVCPDASAAILEQLMTLNESDLPDRLNQSDDPADRLAEASARVMWQEDSASRGLGMRLISIHAGRACLQMTVRDDMVNGHGICHGGFQFLLADSAFAFSCNSRNQRCVAASAEVHFLAPARAGDLLTAVAAEVHRAGRSGVYDIRVTNQRDELIAVFRGKSATIAGQLVEST